MSRKVTVTRDEVNGVQVKVVKGGRNQKVNAVEAEQLWEEYKEEQDCSEELYLVAVDKVGDNISIATSEAANRDEMKVNVINDHNLAKLVYNAIKGKITKIKRKKENNIPSINWIKFDEDKPPKTGWYLTIELPEKYANANKKILKAWVKNNGFNKSYYSNGHFFRYDHTVRSKAIDRVGYWAVIPDFMPEI